LDSPAPLAPSEKDKDRTDLLPRPSSGVGGLISVRRIGVFSNSFPFCPSCHLIFSDVEGWVKSTKKGSSLSIKDDHKITGVFSAYVRAQPNTKLGKISRSYRRKGFLPNSKVNVQLATIRTYQKVALRNTYQNFYSKNNDHLSITNSNRAYFTKLGSRGYQGRNR